jgi:hypothetical protein
MSLSRDVGRLVGSLSQWINLSFEYRKERASQVVPAFGKLQGDGYSCDPNGRHFDGAPPVGLASASHTVAGRWRRALSCPKGGIGVFAPPPIQGRQYRLYSQGAKNRLARQGPSEHPATV